MNYKTALAFQHGRSWFAQWLLSAGIAWAGFSGGLAASAQTTADFNPADILVKPLRGVDLSKALENSSSSSSSSSLPLPLPLNSGLGLSCQPKTGLFVMH